ncbi:nudix hydrolase [Artemisia annua]|uniref:Nudix hydrolase n=1 Tax=Artemisia annua TaxID=35608 RepID=A0A2U1PBD3_ARTAN|nr:nudix hydrolase [Artemisia annua]
MENEYKLLLSCPSGLSPSQVTVNLSESYDRLPHPDIHLENSISKIWDERVQHSKSLFNGKKFRYGGHNVMEPHVCFHLGLTDYRTFVGTNLNPLWERFLAPSEDDCKQCQHTSSPLGNGAIVETSDNKILVLQRSNNVGEFPGYLVFPGGHPEPEEVGITSHKFENGLLKSELNNSKLSQEMFDSIVREVVEEIGVPSATLSEPLFIGISRRVLNVRPAAFFFIKCNLQSTEIHQLYDSAQDGYESTKLYAIQPSELESLASKMPGCHQGGMELYKLMLEAQKNIK